MKGRGRGARLFCLLILILLNLLVAPAVGQMPRYASLRGGTFNFVEWRDAWLKHPWNGLRALVRPTAAERPARDLVGILLLAEVPAFVWLLWPTGADGMPRSSVHADPCGAHGSSRWRNRREIEATLAQVSVEGAKPGAGIVVGAEGRGKGLQAWVAVPGPGVNPHTLVLGAPGSGKTRRIVLPSLWLLGRAGVSIILTDPKGELYSMTSQHFRQWGYEVRVLNLIDPRRSGCYNPLAEVKEAFIQGDTERAGELAWDIAHAITTVEEVGEIGKSEPFWDQSAESLLAALILYVADRHTSDATLARVYRVLTSAGADGGHMLDRMMDSLPSNHPARRAYGVVRLSESRTRSGIMTTAASKMRLFADPVVQAMTARQDYSLADIGRAQVVTYLLLPDDKSGRSMIAAMYLQQTYSALSRVADGHGGRLPVPVHWVLDEFPNVGCFRDWDKMVAVARGRGMAISMICQEYAQLEARYGRDTAEIIAGCCDTWVYLRGNTLSTAKAISDKMGQQTIRTRTGSANLRRYEVSTGTGEHLAGRPLLTPDEVLRWPVGQSLVLQAGQLPAKLMLPDLSAWPINLEPQGQPPVRDDSPEQDSEPEEDAAPFFPEAGGDQCD